MLQTFLYGNFQAIFHKPIDLVFESVAEINEGTSTCGILVSIRSSIEALDIEFAKLETFDDKFIR